MSKGKPWNHAEILRENMSKHTPGPWITKDRKDGLMNIYHADGVQDVALCAKPADALLIVAAPALLEALKWYADNAINMLNHPENYRANDSHVRKARAAIRQATP